MNDTWLFDTATCRWNCVYESGGGLKSGALAALARSGLCGRLPPQEPARLHGAARWARGESPRRVATAERLLRHSG